MYKIIIVKNLLNHFYWILKDDKSPRAIAESRIYTKSEACLTCLNRLNKTLKAKIEWVDLIDDSEL